MTLKLERATTRTQKRLKLGMVSSFDPHNMCAKVERITAKTGCTSCTNWTISFKVQGLVSSFDQHNMCAKVERITTKTGCTSCTNWTIYFKVQAFQTKTH